MVCHSARQRHGRSPFRRSAAFVTDVPRQRFWYAFGQFGNGIYNGLNNAILGLYISAFTGNPFVIGYLSNTRTVEGAIIQPLVGRWSDRTRSRLGRRRPFILGALPVAVGFLALVPAASRAGGSVALPLIFVCIVLFSIFWNIAGDPYQALMIDFVPEGDRTRYNAILSVVALVGQVAILVLAAIVSASKKNIPNGIFYACVVCIVLSYAVVFLGVREPDNAESIAAREERVPWQTYVRDLRQCREAGKLLLSIFFLWTGLNAVTPFLTVYTKTEMHVGNGAAIVIYLVLILAAAISAYPFGRLAGRYGAKRMIVLGTCILIVAAIGGVIAPTYTSLFPVAILAGIGFSATTALTYPFLSQLVPSAKIGVFTGLQASFSSIAVPLSTVATAALIHFFGYRAIFGMQAAMMIVDVVILLSVNATAAREQIAAIERREAAQALAGAI